MDDLSTSELYELFDSLSPYEVAVLAFTSPDALSDDHLKREIVTITTKEAYLWAGAVAHVVIRNPRMERNDIERMLARAIESEVSDASRFGVSGATSFARTRGFYSPRVIDYFMREAGILEDRDVIHRRTDDAVRSLIWRGHIEDPFTKRIRGALLAIIMAMPVSYTSTGPNEVKLNALTWEYSQQMHDGMPSREVRVKVKELADVVMDRIVPDAVNAVRILEGSRDGQGMKDRDVQVRLAELGYYSGPIDGKIGPKTIEALRRFQRDRFLDVTGYVDPDTARRLADH